MKNLQLITSAFQRLPEFGMEAHAAGAADRALTATLEQTEKFLASLAEFQEDCSVDWTEEEIADAMGTKILRIRAAMENLLTIAAE